MGETGEGVQPEIEAGEKSKEWLNVAGNVMEASMAVGELKGMVGAWGLLYEKFSLKMDQTLGQYGEMAKGIDDKKTREAVNQLVRKIGERLSDLKEIGGGWSKGQWDKVGKAHKLLDRLLLAANEGDKKEIEKIREEARFVVEKALYLNHATIERENQEKEPLRRDARDLAETAEMKLMNLREKIGNNFEHWAYRFKRLSREAAEQVAADISGLSKEEREILHHNDVLWNKFRQAVEFAADAALKLEEGKKGGEESE